MGRKLPFGGTTLFAVLHDPIRAWFVAWRSFITIAAPRTGFTRNDVLAPWDDIRMKRPASRTLQLAAFVAFRHS
jgi:hypothetical protein